MKELSIEEKAKAYDEAYKKVAVRFGSNVADEIFLKESEDERIRKELLNYLYDSHDDDEERARWIAWLEKQGEQNPTLPKWKYKKDNTPLLRDSLILNKYGCVAKSPSGALVSDVWVIDYDELAKLPKEEFEKQGEQKPADKVEPKFKIEEGKWYVCTQTYVLRGKIVVIKGQVYQARENGAIKGEDGCLFIDRHDGKASDYFRYWTIQDAKDGDVLYSIDSRQPFIYKERPQFSQAIGYCCINKFGEFAIWNTSKCVICTDKYIPVTKEQRDQLEKAMADAGYTFDFEKKELKKGDKLPAELAKGEDYGIDGLYAAIDILQKTYGKVEGYQTDDGILEHECAISAIKELSKQKPAWSEEDEMFVHGLIRGLSAKRDIHGHTTFSSDCIDITETINWLKSLKGRVQPKMEWGEEDVAMLDSAIAFVEHSAFTTIGKGKNNVIAWLKSLRPQPQWKPSEEQLAAIKFATSRLPDTEKANYIEGVLEELVEQLKAL